jgi:hypothetical protein
MGGPDRLAPDDTGQAERGHQPPGLIPPDLGALAAQGPPQLAHAVHPEVGGMDSGDVGLQCLITDGSRGRWPALGRIVGRWGDRQDLADRLDPEGRPVLVDVVAHLLERRSSSAPKKAAALLQDLAGPAELFVLPLELAHPDPFLGRETGPGAPVDLGLADPGAERLGADAELVGDAADDALVVAVVLHGLGDHAHGPFLDLSWIATRAWVSAGVGHGLHLPSKEWSLH